MNLAVKFEETKPGPLQRFGAIAVCAALVIAAGFAMFYGREAGPQIKPFVLVAATVWSLSDMLTAFLLLVQFFVGGSVALGILATAYAFTSYMTWAYVAAFPGLLRTAPLAHGDQQVSVYLWTIWHCSFPIMLIVAEVYGLQAGHIASRRKIRIATALISVLTPAAAFATAALVYAHRAELPPMGIGLLLTPLWQQAVVPTVLMLNGLALFVLLVRRSLTALSLWLCVAVFAEALDAILNLNTGRYSYAWDVGKCITVVTSSVVLVMILCDIVGLYGQLDRVARVDVLTGLPNRRAFEEHLLFVFKNANRLRGSLAVLVIDIDFFAAYNVANGRAVADNALTTVALEIGRCATRPLDLVARYGGTKFVAVVPNTPLAGVRIIAERIRSSVESFTIVGSEQSSLTVSVGFTQVPDASTTECTALLASAERALGEAKRLGSNTVVFGSVERPGAEDITEVLEPLAAG
jgi:diguanylate cyclase (GGDEF)-like protein